MFYAEDKVLRKCQPHLATVLVVDPFPAASRLLCDLLKQLGARTVLAAADERTAEALIATYEPRLIFVEYGGAANGPELVRRLRRGEANVRKVPVIMCTAEATEASLKAARDAGVHEFLCKPFTVGHLVKRVEAACLKERDWIEARMYVGPDRRRFNSAGYEGPRKRESDHASAEAAAPEPLDMSVLTRVLRALRAALDSYQAEPRSALRAMLDQSAELQALAFATEDQELKAAVLGLQRYLLQSLESGEVRPAEVARHAAALDRFAGRAAASALAA